jgi:hypothetical protein
MSRLHHPAVWGAQALLSRVTQCLQEQEFFDGGTKMTFSPRRCLLRSFFIEPFRVTMAGQGQEMATR